MPILDDMLFPKTVTRSGLVAVLPLAAGVVDSAVGDELQTKVSEEAGDA